MKDNKTKNKIIGISIGILVVLLVVISSTYAYWQITKSQEGSNDIIAACLDIDMESVDGTFALNPAWPLSDDEGKLLEGYTFKVVIAVKLQTILEDDNFKITKENIVEKIEKLLEEKLRKFALVNEATTDMEYYIDNNIVENITR